MKTPMQELIKQLKERKKRNSEILTNKLMIDTANDVLDYAIRIATIMREKEKKATIDFAMFWAHEDFTRKEIEKDYNETFKTK